MDKHEFDPYPKLTESEMEALEAHLTFDEVSALIDIYLATGVLPEYVGFVAVNDLVTPINHNDCL